MSLGMSSERSVRDTRVYVQIRQIPHSLEEIVHKEVNDMIQINNIEQSDSPYCSPIIVVHKKDGTIRYALIFNNQTVFDSMPDATDRCSKLASCRSFTKIDPSKGYWQVKLTVASRPKTACRTGQGFIQIRVALVRITASVTFLQLIRKIKY